MHNIPSFYLIYGLRGLDRRINGRRLGFEREQERSNGIKETHLGLKFQIWNGFCIYGLYLEKESNVRRIGFLRNREAEDRVSFD